MAIFYFSIFKCRRLLNIASDYSWMHVGLSAVTFSVHLWACLVTAWYGPLDGIHIYIILFTGAICLHVATNSNATAHSDVLLWSFLDTKLCGPALNLVC